VMLTIFIEDAWDTWATWLVHNGYAYIQETGRGNIIMVIE
jgi:hypothetical protein